MNIFQELQWRDLIHTASEGLQETMAAGPMVGYIGFDPSAASLHIGSLLPIMNLARMQRLGHRPIEIAGGGTGLIGDPSGKTLERQLMTRERVAENLAEIRGQLERFLDFEARANPAKIIDNADWLTTISLMDFLRDIGKYFTVNYMLAKDSVGNRLESESGISFTEFSYMLLQAYDFLVLYDREGCTLQMGGSDQWGNIVAGIDLIRRLRQGKVHGLVSPLVTTASGVKFGKTEAGAVWLDGLLTSPFQFFQFWFNTDIVGLQIQEGGEYQPLIALDRRSGAAPDFPAGRSTIRKLKGLDPAIVRLPGLPRMPVGIGVCASSHPSTGADCACSWLAPIDAIVRGMERRDQVPRQPTGRPPAARRARSSVAVRG